MSYETMAGILHWAFSLLPLWGVVIASVILQGCNEEREYRKLRSFRRKG